MRQVTIENSYGVITVHEGVLTGSRREWTVTGQVDMFIKGKFDELEYDSAANLACNVAQGMNIPVSMVRRVTTFKTRSAQRSEKQAKLL